MSGCRGHITNTHVDDVSSIVFSLRGLRFVVFLGELSECKVWATHKSNIYLEIRPKAKFCFVADPEFEKLKRNNLVIIKAIYDIRISGIRSHEIIVDTLYDIGFFSSKSEDDI